MPLRICHFATSRTISTPSRNPKSFSGSFPDFRKFFQFAAPPDCVRCLTQPRMLGVFPRLFTPAPRRATGFNGVSPFPPTVCGRRGGVLRNELALGRGQSRCHHSSIETKRRRKRGQRCCAWAYAFSVGTNGWPVLHNKKHKRQRTNDKTHAPVPKHAMSEFAPENSIRPNPRVSFELDKLTSCALDTPPRPRCPGSSGTGYARRRKSPPHGRFSRVSPRV
jgi:hypothetical protein